MNIHNRAASYPKQFFTETNQKNQKNVDEIFDSELNKEINQRFPGIDIEKNKHMADSLNCTEGIEKSHLSDISKLFKSKIMWPFSPNLKKNQRVDATARLSVFLSLSVITISTLSHLPFTPYSFDVLRFGSTGTFFLIASIVSFNILLYFIQKMHLKSCISYANRQVRNSDRIKLKASENHKIKMRMKDTEDYKNNYVNLKPRTQIRQKQNLSTHIGTPGIIGEN